LAADADLICLDEPAAGLDPEAVEDMVQLIQQLIQQGKTILLVEHNLEIVRQVCHQVMFLDQGRLVVAGSPQTVLNDPRVFRGFMGI
jgi:ABC-type branched-subunit amino acid transport system ATPase component